MFDQKQAQSLNPILKIHVGSIQLLKKESKCKDEQALVNKMNFHSFDPQKHQAHNLNRVLEIHVGAIKLFKKRKCNVEKQLKQNEGRSLIQQHLISQP